MDNRDDRREVWTALIRGLNPIRRVDFLDWCCELLRATGTSALKVMAANARADRDKMRNIVKRAWLGDAVADMILTNEIYADVVGLCHQWGLDYGIIANELESWAKGREPTPPELFVSPSVSPSASDPVHSRNPDTISSDDLSKC